MSQLPMRRAVSAAAVAVLAIVLAASSTAVSDEPAAPMAIGPATAQPRTAFARVSKPTPPPSAVPRHRPATNRPAAAPVSPVARSAPRPPLNLRTVFVSLSATLATLQQQIDRCAGAVLTFDLGVPLIAQHNYCGGAGHLGSLSVGQQVRLSGAGGLDGTYHVASRGVVPKCTSSTVLAGRGDVVLHTCYSNSLLLTGLRRD